jgi:hypothetical protein
MNKTDDKDLSPLVFLKSHYFKDFYCISAHKNYNIIIEATHSNEI